MIKHYVGSRVGNGDRLPPTSGFVAACPGLTELTIICSPSLDTEITTSETLFDLVGKTRSAISELVTLCKALPDFDTLQIVYIPILPRSPICRCGKLWCPRHPLSVERDQASKNYIKPIKDWAMEYLERPRTECQEGEGSMGIALRERLGDVKLASSKRSETGRKRTTLRVIKLAREPLNSISHRAPVMVEEYEV